MRIYEGYSKIDESAHVTGIALIPRISRNENLYTKKELQRFDNVTVPLNWEHDNSIQIGTATFHYNPELETVYYEGDITDEKYASLARNKTLFTSIEATPKTNTQVCNQPDDCFNMPNGLVPEALALTEVPGIPETSLKVIESVISKIERPNDISQIKTTLAEIKDFLSNSSLVSIASNDKSMTEQESKKDSPVTETEDCPEGQVKNSDGQCVDKTSENAGECPPGQTKDADGNCVDKAAENAEECPEGQHMVDGQCVPKSEKKKEGGCGCSGKKEAKPVEVKHDSTKGIAEKLDAIYNQITKPIAQVSNTQTSKYDTVETAAKKVERFFDEGTPFKLNFSYDQLRGLKIGPVKGPSGVYESFRSVPPAKLTEALSFSGTQSGIDYNTSAQMVPGGITDVPFRQFAEFKAIPKGENTARFFKHTMPSVLSQTAGTTATEASMSVTSVEVAPSTISGVYLKIDTDDIEDNPYETVNVVANAASGVVTDFESTDALTTVSAEGTLTPGLWIRGDTGATITSSDIAANVFDETAVAVARQHFADQGYLKFGKPVGFLHPKQYRELITSSGISSYLQQGVPGITTTGNFAELYGVTLVETNAVEEKSNTTNDAYNAIFCIPQLSYGAASKRDVQIGFHDITEDNQIRMNVTWRYKSVVKDATSVVRASSTK